AACATARVARATESPVSLTAADVHPRDYPTVAAVGWINEQLAAEFGGELSLRVYHSGQLGSEKDTLELARIGALAIARVHSSVLNNVVPATRILSLPYVFDSTEHMRRAFDGAFGNEILAACEQRGLIGLALYDSGSRIFYNTRHPIEVPSDLHGLKLRVPQSDIFIESVEALGASPTPLAYNAVFSALSTHLIDGAENNWPSYYTSRHFEIAPYFSESEHSYAPDVLLMSKRVADALPPRQRDFLLAAARGSLPLMRARWDELVDKARRTVVDAGVTVAVIDRPAFRRAVQPMLDRHLHDPQIMRLHDLLRDSA
ncbi:MAG TPA: TRAP transporter substrate-binding protein, partial [Gammaproteobacteria bacterium]